MYVMFGRGLTLIVATLLMSLSGNAVAEPLTEIELCGLLTEEYTTMPDLLDRLEQLEQLLTARGDSRAVFAAMYRVITERAERAIDEGYFDDGEWTTRLLVSFSNFYRQAFLDYECGQRERVPEVWRIVFDARDDEDVTVLQHALLGMHAHINRDLPLAIAQVTPHKERADRYSDFYATNVFFLQTIDAVEDVIAQYDPELRRLDKDLGGLDEVMLGVMLTQWRFRAWRRASLFDGSLSEGQEQLLLWLLDLATARNARRLRDL